MKLRRPTVMRQIIAVTFEGEKRNGMKLTAERLLDQLLT
jgi:hypothetical protein